jgi:RHS repeat-associated protein
LDCTCPQAPNFPYNGAVLEAYEFRRFQTGANPFWTPLRFSGQYFDAETDVFENWNRYFEAAVGRYLGPEPLTETPSFAWQSMFDGKSAPAFAYAFNNALAFVDSDGLQAGCTNTYDCCLQKFPNNPEACGGDPQVDPQKPPPPEPRPFPPVLPRVDPRREPMECGKDRWGCTCSCYRRSVNSGVNDSYGPKVEGFGTGSDAKTACNAAQDDANETIKRNNPGEFKGHCNCQASKL